MFRGIWEGEFDGGMMSGRVGLDRDRFGKTVRGSSG